jgi:myo-inositol-1(or 4)-monophosphatase
MNVMTRAAEKAGRSILRDFGEVEQLQVSMKGPADFVSQADHKSEQVLRYELTKARPDYGFMAEESEATKGTSEYTWIVDPLDGTTNFLHGIPHWCISVALAKGNEIVAGVVYEPVRDEMFWGEKGTGAFSNSKRLRVSTRRDLSHALIATGIPFKGSEGLAHADTFMEEMKNIMPKVAGIRRYGAAALDLAYVAAGRYEGFWERGLKPWDVAAGIILIKEAGGFVAPLKKGDDPLFGGNLIATNDALQTQLCGLLGAN